MTTKWLETNHNLAATKTRHGFEEVYPRFVGEMWSGAFASVYIITDPTVKPYPTNLTPSCLNLTNQINEGNQSEEKTVLDLVYSISMTMLSVIGYVSCINAFLYC